MKVFDLFFNILHKFTPMSGEQVGELASKVKADLDRVIMDKDSPDYKPSWKTWLKERERNPYFEVLTAIAYFPLVKWIPQWMQPETEEDKENRDNFEKQKTSWF